MAYRYTVQMNEKSARAVGIGLPISMKQSIEICKWIRGKPVEKAKGMLVEVMGMKRPVPYTRFTGNTGHRKGPLATGRYPINACKHILHIINSAAANAQAKGLGADLTLSQVCAQDGGNSYRFGRHRGRKAKRTHIEVVVEEKKK